MPSEATCIGTATIAVRTLGLGLMTVQATCRFDFTSCTAKYATNTSADTGWNDVSCIPCTWAGRPIHTTNSATATPAVRLAETEVAPEERPDEREPDDEGGETDGGCHSPPPPTTASMYCCGASRSAAVRSA